jgi:putative Ca2+/H+ antiporter (TMEM165/GDT1 family)
LYRIVKCLTDYDKQLLEVTMAANDDDESMAVIVGVLAGIVLAVVAVVFGASAGKGTQPTAAVKMEQAEIAPSW